MAVSLDEYEGRAGPCRRCRADVRAAKATTTAAPKTTHGRLGEVGPDGKTGVLYGKLFDATEQLFEALAGTLKARPSSRLLRGSPHVDCPHIGGIPCSNSERPTECGPTERPHSVDCSCTRRLFSPPPSRARWSRGSRQSLDATSRGRRSIMMQHTRTQAAKKRGVVTYDSPLLLKGAHDGVRVVLLQPEPAEG